MFHDDHFGVHIEEVLDTIFQQDQAAFLRWINRQPLTLNYDEWCGISSFTGFSA